MKAHHSTSVIGTDKTGCPVNKIYSRGVAAAAVKWNLHVVVLFQSKFNYLSEINFIV